MTALRISLLGPLQVFLGDKALDTGAWRSRQTRTLFRVLAVHYGHVVTADQLLEILWPDDPPDVSRSRLHVRVSQLRRALNPEDPSAYILTVEDGYTWNPAADTWFDTVAFEDHIRRAQEYLDDGRRGDGIAAYESARALYRGDLLEEDLYADWTIVQRESLRETFLVVLTELAELYAQQGRYRSAIASCRQVLERDPCREAVYVRLMLYHYYAGERPQALDVFERCCNILSAELGVEPMPKTVTLAEGIRDGSLWAAEDAPRYPPPAYEGRLFEVPYSLGHAPLVGREREYSWLVDSWRDEQSSVLLLEGEAGVGKSRLIEEFLGFAASEGAKILRTRLAAVERLPYSAVAAVLRPLLDTEDLEGVDLAPLMALFPELISRYPDLADPSPSSVHQRRAQLLAAASSLLDRHTAERLIIFVDDAQRAGAASLELFAQLSRRATLVLACRSEETAPDHPLRVALRPFRQQGRVQDLVLAPLAPSHVQRLLFQFAGDELPALSELVCSQTAGNPLFVIASLQHLFERGVLYVGPEGRWDFSQEPTFSLPPTVREAIEHRLRGLGPDQCRVFDLVAVISSDLSFTLLQAASQLEEERLIEALDLLIQGGLLIEPRRLGRGDFAVAHDRFSEVAYDSLPRVRQRQLHRRVAHALVDLRGDDPTASGETAYHFHRGGQLAEAAQYALRAGRYAQQLYTGQQAIDHLQHAIQWSEEAGLSYENDELAQLQIDLGDALRYVGRYEEALDHFQRAFPIARGELKQVALFHVISLRTTQGAGNLAELEEMVRTIEPEVVKLGDSWSLAALRWVRGYMVGVRGEVIEARACTAEGWHVARRLLAAGKEAPPWMASWSYMSLARSHERWGKWRRAVRYARRSLELSSQQNDPYGIAASHVTLAAAHYGLGEWKEALDHSERCFKLAVEAEDPRWQGEALYRAGLVYLEKGAWENAEENAQRILSAAQATGDLLRIGFGQLLLALLAMRQGEPQRAIPVLQVQEAVAAKAAATTYLVLMRRYLAEAYLLTGDIERANSTAREGIELASRCGMKRELGGLWRVLGEAAWRVGDDAAATRYLSSAADMASRISCRYDLAQVTWAQSRVLEEHGGPAAALLAERALALLEELGAEYDIQVVKKWQAKLNG